MSIEARLDRIEVTLNRLWRTVLVLLVVVAALAGALTCEAVFGADAVAPLEYQAGPADWTGWQIADLVLLPEHDRPFMRYLAIPHWGNEQWVPALNFAVNTAVAHAQTIQLGTVLANGWMVRYDLRRLVPQHERLAKTIATWDGLAKQDPYLHIPDSNVKLGLAVLSPAIPPDHAALAANMTLSVGSIYRADWFIAKALSTINGGAYYDFRQVVKQPEKGTALDNWLSSRGLFVASTANVGGERRAAMFRSEVTGKPRRVDLFPTLAGGLGSITRDVKDGSIEAKQHPLRNLLRFADDGSEVIVAQPNGMLDYVLSNSDGDIVDEAPPDLVRDHTIPPPFTSRLQPARSCISCHSLEGEDGWRRVRNDVQTVLNSQLNIFADFADLKLTKDEALDKLAGFYALDVEHADGILARARRDHSTAVYRCCAGIKFPAEKSIVAQVGQLVTSIIHDYDYSLVTPARAAQELGYRLPANLEGNPLALALGEIDPRVESDPVIGFLRVGISVNRTDLETVYQDLLNLSQARREQ